MTLIQAKAVASAAVDAGFNASLVQTASGVWNVEVVALSFTIDVQAAAGLATSQGVAGKIARIQYS